MIDLKGKEAVVTGGASGIGEAISKSLAKAGANVTIWDMDIASGKRVRDEIIETGRNSAFDQVNVADYGQVAKAFESRFSDKSLDILINNAGVAHIGNVEDTSSEDFERVFQVNVKGVFHCLKGCVGYMKSKGGSIINLASIASLVGIPDRFAYSMSKGAVHTMTLSMAKDYLKYNIRCNSVAPARIHTPFVDGFLKKHYEGQEEEMFDKLSKTQPLGRMGEPAEVASLVTFLCSDEAAFITGSSYPIDGGFTTLNN